MHILVSNDDGYLAPGLRALADAMRVFGDVTVVAPDRRSPDYLKKFLGSEIAQWAGIIKASGVSLH